MKQLACWFLLHYLDCGFLNNPIPGLSLRAGGWGFSLATTSLSPGYFDIKRKYWKEKNTSIKKL